MLLASQDYPLLNLFWTMLWLFLWILWIFLVVRIIMDIFRSADLSGWGKAGWTIFVIILPFIGILTYIIARGTTMQERDLEQAKAADAKFKQYVQNASTSATSSASTADEITKLSALHTQGVLTDAEFSAQKAKLLS